MKKRRLAPPVNPTLPTVANHERQAMRKLRNPTPINDQFNQPKYRGFNERLNRIDVSKHGPVKIIYSRDPSPVLDPMSVMGERAKGMRRDPPKGEMILRDALERFRPMGITFQHQAVLFHYIADFYCEDRKLVIEVDGVHHKKRKAYDRQRDCFLYTKGIVTMRINARRVHNVLDSVMLDIARVLGCKDE